VTNTYFEHTRPDAGIVIDKAAVLADHVRMRARFAKSGRWFLVGDLNMRTGSPLLSQWETALGASRLETGNTHSHTHKVSSIKSTIDQVLVLHYNRWNAPALIDDATLLDVDLSSDHRPILASFNLYRSSLSHRIPARLISRIHEMDAATETAYTSAIGAEADKLIAPI
jgi:hypothetical protein